MKKSAKNSKGVLNELGRRIVERWGYLVAPCPELHQLIHDVLNEYGLLKRVAR